MASSLERVIEGLALFLAPLLLLPPLPGAAFSCLVVPWGLLLLRGCCCRGRASLDRVALRVSPSPRFTVALSTAGELDASLCSRGLQGPMTSGAKGG